MEGDVLAPAQPSARAEHVQGQQLFLPAPHSRSEKPPTSRKARTRTPEQIADVLERWREAGINGINNTIPGTYLEFIEHVLPVLWERGLARREHTSAPVGGSSPVPTTSTTDIPLPPTEVPSPDR